EINVVDPLARRLAAGELGEGGARAAAAVTHVRMDEDAVDTLDLAQTLVQLDVGNDTSGQHEMPESGLLQVLRDVGDRHLFEHALIRRGDVDLRKLGRQQAREVDVVGLDDAESAVGVHEPPSEDVAEHFGIAVSSEADDLALVTAGRETERG